MKMIPEIFRAYDIRGIAMVDFDADFAYELGRAFATLVIENNGKSIALSRDCRLSGPALYDGLKAGVATSGLEIYDLGLLPTPGSYFATNYYKGVDAAVQVTGSHNPKDHNGFKISLGKTTIHSDQILYLRQLIETKSYKTLGTTSTFASLPLAEDYIKFVSEKTKVKKPLRVAIDSGNGMGSVLAPEAFKRAGHEVHAMYCSYDGNFPNHHPDPSEPHNMDDLIKEVAAKKLDLGIAFDGDADRIGVVTAKGKILYGDQILVLLADSILRKPGRKGATVIGEVKCSNFLYDKIAEFGGTPLMWKTGHSLIKQKMKETHALLAGEMSGHIFIADDYFGYDDAIYAALRLAEFISQENISLDDYIGKLPETYSTPELRVDCPDKIKFRIIDEIKKFLPADLEVNAIDGLRFRFPHGWGLVRASNTQPILVMRTEANQPQRRDEYKTIIEQWIDRAKANM